MRRGRAGASPRGTAVTALASVETASDADGNADDTPQQPGEGGEDGRKQGPRAVPDLDLDGEPSCVPLQKDQPRLWHITLSVSGAAAPLAEVRRGLEQLAHDHPFLLTSRYANDHAEIRYWEEARDLHDAAAIALRLWGEHRNSAKLPAWETVGLEVIDRETYHQRIAEGHGPLPATPVGVHPF